MKEALIMELLEDLALALPSSDLIYQREGEPDPLSIQIPSFKISQASGTVEENLPVLNSDNAACKLCQDRLFPVKQYFKKGKIPVLILYYAGSTDTFALKADRSDRFFTGNSESDDVLLRLFARAGFEMDDFFYQEFLACHFNPERSLPADWEERSKHCYKFIESSVLAHNIQYILAIGWPAPAILGQKIALALSENNECEIIAFGEKTVRMYVLRSTGAIFALEQKRKKSRKQEEKEKLLEMEKSIKLSSLALMQKLRTLV